MSAIVLVLPGLATPAELRGHGGPVRALALAPDGALLSGSFDGRAILWSPADGTARAVLSHHASEVAAVAVMPDGRLVTGGQDGGLAVWGRSGGGPHWSVVAHEAPIASLAVAPDGGRIASAGWDGAIRLSAADGGAVSPHPAGHPAPVNGVAFAADGSLLSIGQDRTLRLWRADGSAAGVVGLPAPPNALAVASDGRALVASADGRLVFADPDTGVVEALTIGDRPLLTLAVLGDRIAVGDAGGGITLLSARKPDDRMSFSSGAAPVWALAFDRTGDRVMAAGGDSVIRSWNASNGTALDPPPGPSTETPTGGRGAEVFRACGACHTLSRDDGHRAGPSLHGLFGRRIASAPGYRYSPALREMDLVWTPATVAELFTQGPAAYTPGSKMPEQRIPNADDLAALIDFLREATQ